LTLTVFHSKRRFGLDVSLGHPIWTQHSSCLREDSFFGEENVSFEITKKNCNMPLGLLAKDSMVNLTELVEAKEEEGELDMTFSIHKLDTTPGDDVMVQVLPEGDNGVNTVVPVEQQLEGSSHSDLDAVIISPSDSKETPVSGTSVPDIHDENSPSIVPGDSKASTSNTTDEAMGSASKDEITSNGSVASSFDSDAAKMAAGRAVGQYSGFSADYHDFENYANYATYANDAATGKLVATHFDTSFREEVPWWCCFFPWITGAKLIEDDSTIGQDEPEHASIDNLDEARSALNEELPAQGNLSRSSSTGDDEISTGSGMFGEKLSDKEKQAVIARLKLAQPEVASHSSQQQTDESPTSPDDGSKTLPWKGILKRSNTTITSSNKDLHALTHSSGRQSLENGRKQRRSLFPTYETRAPSERKDLHPNFAPMARVVTIKSLKDMSEQEKSQIWWQKADYEEFRRTGRMITKAMLEGGSEIWLATNQSWQMPNQGKAQTLQHAYSLADRHAAFKKGDLKAKQDYEDTRDKWWHKFGHSRRGLEHIASIDEGRQRQANVKTSIRAVLEEQRRQKVFHREDPEKLRMVSIQNTTWAKDLALASGASDADCIQKNFDDDNRRTREFYLLKFSRANQSSNAPASAKKVMPAFMKPMMTMQIPKNRLDAHTTSQIRYRQAQEESAQKVAMLKRTSSELPESSTHVPIRDEENGHGSSMAKKGKFMAIVLFCICILHTFLTPIVLFLPYASCWICEW
jgi:hypothetical protein